MASWWAALRTGVWTAPLVLAGSALFASLSLLACVVSRGGRFSYRLARAWSRLALRVAGVRVEVEGAEKIAPGSSYVLVADHLSPLDIPCILAHVSAQIRLLVDKKYFSIPVVGFYLRRSGHLAVSGANPRQSLEALTAAARLIAGREISVLVFPEGGRGRGGPLPFRDGAAYLAIRAGAPIVSIALQGAGEVLPLGSLVVRKGVVRMRIGDPIPTLDLKLEDRTRLSESLRTSPGEFSPPLAGARPN